jgi:hypothetical protein
VDPRKKERSRAIKKRTLLQWAHKEERKNFFEGKNKNQ